MRLHTRLQVNEIVASQAAMSKELDNVLEAYFAIQPRRDREQREYGENLLRNNAQEG
jgi:hypothetical protein